MINILFFIETTDIGGAEQRIINIVNYFSKQNNYKVYFAYIKKGLLHKKLLEHNIQTIKVPLNSKNIYDCYKAGWFLADFLKTNNIDFVYSGLIRTDLICLFARLKINFKLFSNLVSCYNYETIISSKKNLCEFFLRNLIHAVSKKVISNNKNGIKPFIFKKKFIINDNFITEQTVNEIKRNFKVQNKNENEIILGTLSRLDTVKNPYIVVESAEKLSFLTHKKIKIIWVGPLQNIDFERLKTNNVEFLHVKEHEKRFEYLNLFDICFLLSEREGVSNFLIEAMIAEKPIIASDCGDSRRILFPETSIVIKHKNSDKISQALNWFVNNRPKKAVFEKVSRKVLNRYNIKNHVNKLEQIFKGL